MSHAPLTLAIQLGQALSNRRQRLATAESCTGGWIAKLITDVPGSSTWFERGFVTYSNTAKQEMLGVRDTTLATHGAVSATTVEEMALGALAHSYADLAVAVSGIAGPDGGSPDKPVGLVWLGWAFKDEWVHCHHRIFTGDREAVRQQAAIAALQGLLDRMDG
ncbi:MAG: nicotinamide-nucleotide amidase [Gammaproteobacteria bacterium]|nr:nicotinamide-nucleotide amidase [Gammaproteobacteria bacterium]MCP5424811.1 nicotinamide-nucleotide amidase [Gammaproteobacteria bacterium]MCP5458212.1 nicotinamide-nucleotide amidase [Gammaproteobacteria bacterium]